LHSRCCRTHEQPCPGALRRRAEGAGPPDGPSSTGGRIGTMGRHSSPTPACTPIMRPYGVGYLPSEAAEPRHPTSSIRQRVGQILGHGSQLPSGESQTTGAGTLPRRRASGRARLSLGRATTPLIAIHDVLIAA
jgi:hypothetical protein